MRYNVQSDRSNEFIRALVDVLSERRRQLEISQHELDDRLGMADGVVAKWETGYRRPSPDNLWCWCHALGVRLVAEVE